MLCEFKKFLPRNEWTYDWNVGQFKTPKYGKPSGKHGIVRCPMCNKRLQVRAIYCVGGEWTGWELPDHKAKEKTKRKQPSRKTKGSGRGK